MEYDLCYFLMNFSDEEPIQISSGGMIFNQRPDRKSLKNPEKASEEKKNSQRKLESAKKSLKVTKNESKSSSWPYFADEEYMVFCFRDDGQIDLEEGKAAAAADQGGWRDRGSSRRSNHKVEEEGSTNLPPHDDDIKEITEVEEARKWELVPESLSGSTRSNSSSSSFAFPVMNWEWKSSPQRMPRLEEQLKEMVPESEQQPRKAVRRRARFHCCRF